MIPKAELPHADEGQRDLVVLVVAVRVPVLHGAQDPRQLLRRLRRVQLQLPEPGGVDPHDVVALEGIDRRQRGNGALRCGDRFLPLRVLLKQLPQVRGVLLQVRRQVDNASVPVQGPDLVLVQFRLEQHVRQVVPADDILLSLRPFLPVRLLPELEGDPGILLHPGKEQVVVPHTVGNVAVKPFHNIVRRLLRAFGARAGP